MGRQKRYKDPVRFSLQLEKSLVMQLDELAEAYGVERNILIDRILRKQAATNSNPFELDKPSAGPQLIAAEDPAAWNQKPNADQPRAE